MSRLTDWVRIGVFLAFGRLWEAGDQAQVAAWEDDQ